QELHGALLAAPRARDELLDQAVDVLFELGEALLGLGVPGDELVAKLLGAFVVALVQRFEEVGDQIPVSLEKDFYLGGVAREVRADGGQVRIAGSERAV